MTVKFRAMLSDGRVLVGPIQGNGGELGNGCLHLGIAAARRHALRALQMDQARAEGGRAISIYEPEPGCVALFPEWSFESRGEHVAVPLVGTKFTLAPIRR